MLTDTRARKLKPEDKPIADGSIVGLVLHPGAHAGRGKWILRFKSPVTGKRRDMGLGSYPEVSLASVRRKAFEAREIIASGGDPLELRRKEERASEIRAAPFFEEAARLVFDEIKGGFRNAKHTAQWISTLETYAFPIIGDRRVDELRASDFADVLRPIWLNKPETASRVRQRCDTVMKWCAARDYVVASPVGVVSTLLARQPGKRERVEHHPALVWRDIPGFVVRVLRSTPPTSVGKQALEFTLLTAARSGEVRGMKWEEIDLKRKIWTVPAGRMKARTIHRVPLTPRTLEILRARWPFRDASDLVFSSRRNARLSDMTLTKILRDANVGSDSGARTATVHGFRSSFRDWASENGYPRDLAERALAHTIKNAAEAAYHRTDLLEQRRKAMETWERFVLRSGQDAAMD
jgi:integrase